MRNGDPEGSTLLEESAGQLEKQLRAQTIDENECRMLANISRELGQTEMAQEAEARAKTFTNRHPSSAAYSEDNLVGRNRSFVEGV
jgi:BRCT domain type II-containing protein